MSNGSHKRGTASDVLVSLSQTKVDFFFLAGALPVKIIPITLFNEQNPPFEGHR